MHNRPGTDRTALQFDGASYTQTSDLPVTNINIFATYANVPFAGCNKDVSTTHHQRCGHDVDAAVGHDRRNISGITSFEKMGPTISNISPEGVGSSKSGTYSYVITYVDYAGWRARRARAGPTTTSPHGRLKIEWQDDPECRCLSIYRTIEANGRLARSGSSTSTT